MLCKQAWSSYTQKSKYLPKSDFYFVQALATTQVMFGEAFGVLNFPSMRGIDGASNMEILSLSLGT
jgi:hypothetical protein